MGRPPIGKVAMTGAQRIQRWRLMHGKSPVTTERLLALAKARVADLEGKMADFHKVTIEKIERVGERGGKVTKWVGRINGKKIAEALTRCDAEKWTYQHYDWLRKQDADPGMYY